MDPTMAGSDIICSERTPYSLCLSTQNEAQLRRLSHRLQRFDQSDHQARLSRILLGGLFQPPLRRCQAPQQFLPRGCGHISVRAIKPTDRFAYSLKLRKHPLLGEHKIMSWREVGGFLGSAIVAAAIIFALLNWVLPAIGRLALGI
jgi:hypothetical protein